ncbi:MAG: sigma-70 family RNA polymerase sigma factor [bacterium]|nr:sigma-70 family RNA polymerase sigma factor [bacterium]
MSNANQDPPSLPLGGDELPQVPDCADLAHRCCDGDKEALEILLQRYQERIRRIVRIRLGSHMRQNLEMMDLVQDLRPDLLALDPTLAAGDESEVLAWLSRAVFEQIRGAPPQEGTPPAPAARAEEIDEHRPNTALLPEERAWRSELREILDESMTKLSERYREVILMRDYCQGEWDQVTRILGEPNEQAAQALHRRAWIKLRRLVRPRLNGLV